MADAFTWGQVGRLCTSAARFIPDRLMRWVYPRQRILDRVEAFHFDQAPRFFIRRDRDQPELQVVGFNMFNFTPLDLKLVGADVRLSIDSREFCRLDKRFPAEIDLQHYARGGFNLPVPLAEGIVGRLRRDRRECVNLSVTGHVILSGPYGEQSKPINAAVVATIDRD